jgi:broad specificity phosphatase PhoE
MESPPKIVDGAFFSSLSAQTRFIIVRHGQSECNARGLIQGKLDCPLDEAGRDQARMAGSWLATRKVEELLASPLARAAETGRILAAACGLGEPTYDERLAELDTGIFTGLSIDEAKERHPEVYDDFERRSWEAVPGAESPAALYVRAIEAWTLLRGRAETGRRVIACVSHGGFIQWLLRSTFGCRTWMPLFSTGNCGVFELLVIPRGLSGPAYLQWRHINFQPSTSIRQVEPIF